MRLQLKKDNDVADGIILDMAELEAVLYDSEKNVQPKPDKLKDIILNRLEEKYGNDETEMKSMFGDFIELNHLEYDIAPRDEKGRKKGEARSTIWVGIGKGIVWLQKV